MLYQVGTFQNVGPGLLQVRHTDFGETRLQRLFDVNLRDQKIAAKLGQGVQVSRSQLHLLVLQQAAYQFGTRVLGLLPDGNALGWQQHARFDFYEHGCHQQVLGCQLQIVMSDFFNITQILACQGGHWNVKDIEILLADQVQQQVHRAFKGLQKDFQRIGRNVQILRHGKQRLAIQARHRNLIDHRWHGGVFNVAQYCRIHHRAQLLLLNK
ncbi:hypothetical protein GALL_488620 [mine drainage metagenome]|uniref:Uncharacterized protein n=1 Tax=mine drainage metagenome TaxID=410659 RepID=A0A1J5Q0Y9_9ZZZZ